MPGPSKQYLATYALLTVGGVSKKKGDHLRAQHYISIFSTPTQHQISNSPTQHQISIPPKQLSTQIPRLIPILQLNIPNPTHQFSTLSQFSNSTSCPTFKSKTQFQHLILIHQKQAHKLNFDQQCTFTFKYTKL